MSTTETIPDNQISSDGDDDPVGGPNIWGRFATGINVFNCPFSLLVFTQVELLFHDILYLKEAKVLKLFGLLGS